MKTKNISHNPISPVRSYPIIGVLLVILVFGWAPSIQAEREKPLVDEKAPVQGFDEEEIEKLPTGKRDILDILKKTPGVTLDTSGGKKPGARPPGGKKPPSSGDPLTDKLVEKGFIKVGKDGKPIKRTPPGRKATPKKPAGKGTQPAKGGRKGGDDDFKYDLGIGFPKDKGFTGGLKYDFGDAGTKGEETYEFDLDGYLKMKRWMDGGGVKVDPPSKEMQEKIKEWDKQDELIKKAGKNLDFGKYEWDSMRSGFKFKVKYKFPDDKKGGKKRDFNWKRFEKFRFYKNYGDFHLDHPYERGPGQDADRGTKDVEETFQLDPNLIQERLREMQGGETQVAPPTLIPLEDSADQVEQEISNSGSGDSIVCMPGYFFDGVGCAPL